MDTREMLQGIGKVLRDTDEMYDKSQKGNNSLLMHLIIGTLRGHLEGIKSTLEAENDRD